MSATTPADLRKAAAMSPSEWAQALGIDPATSRRYEADASLPSSRSAPAPTLQLMQLLAGVHQRWKLSNK